MLHRGAGCRACHQTGYRGRIGIFELMVTGDTIRELCVQRVNAAVIRNQALKEGMLTLRQDGWRRVGEVPREVSGGPRVGAAVDSS